MMKCTEHEMCMLMHIHKNGTDESRPIAHGYTPSCTLGMRRRLDPRRWGGALPVRAVLRWGSNVTQVMQCALVRPDSTT